jgi:hypothetical protein
MLNIRPPQKQGVNKKSVFRITTNHLKKETEQIYEMSCASDAAQTIDNIQHPYNTFKKLLIGSQM